MRRSTRITPPVGPSRGSLLTASIAALVAATLTACGSSDSDDAGGAEAAGEESSEEATGPQDALEFLDGCSFEPAADTTIEEGFTTFAGTNDSEDRLDLTSISYTLTTDQGEVELSTIVSMWQGGEELAWKMSQSSEEPLGKVSGCEVTGASVSYFEPSEELKDESTTCSVKAAEFGSVVDVTYELGDVTAEQDLQIFMGLYEDGAHVNTVSLEAAAGESTGTTGGGDHPDATCEVISLRSPT